MTLVALLLTGCAGTPQLSESGLRGLPARVELADVPHYVQQTHQCGPAALASALDVAGIDATPESLAPEVFTASRKGSLPLDMLGGARRSGALAVRIPSELPALFHEVAAGRPVVVLQNLSLPIYPVWHYAVVVGFDLEQREVLLRSGTESRQTLSFRTFDYTWARSGRWAMIALAPGDLPVADDRQTYLEAALALERLGQLTAARRAYDAGLGRWPADLTLLMGAANSAHALHDAQTAELRLRQAAAAHPDSAVVLNNLAHVLAERDALQEAFALAERAVELGGPQHTAALATREQIAQRLRSAAQPVH